MEAQGIANIVQLFILKTLAARTVAGLSIRTVRCLIVVPRVNIQILDLLQIIYNNEILRILLVIHRLF